MSVLNTNERRAGPFLGNGSTVLTMSFPFLVYEAADLLVSWSDSAGNATWPYATLVLGTDYTVTLNPDQVSAPGCVVTTTAVAPVTTSVVLTSDLANTIDVQVAGSAAAPINSGFDRLAILIQQLAEQVSRVPVVPVGGIGDQSPASLVFGVGLNGSGNPVPVLSQLANIALTAVSGFVGGLLQAANLPGFLAALGLPTFLQNFLNAGNQATSQAALGLGSAATLTAGTAANNVVQLNASGQLPAVDGSLLLHISRSPTRQTVLSGPTDSNGNAAFGGSTGVGITSVTPSAALVVTAAGGFNAYGAVDRVGSGTPTWSGLNAASTTYYLFVTVNADGSLTPFTSNVAPVYANHVATPAITSGAFSFDWSAMVGYLGNGSAAPQSFSACVGVATTSAGSYVNSIAWFALSGKYDSGWISGLPGAAASFGVTHNLFPNASGVDCSPIAGELILQNATAQGGYTPGQLLRNVFTDASGSLAPFTPVVTPYSLTYQTGSSAGFEVVNTSGANLALTAADWNYRIVVKRGW